MQQPRRIFRPAASKPRWRVALLIAGGLLIGAILAAIGVPAALMGSAPREQDWSALAAEVRIVDGDTLLLGDRTVRLAGVSAPGRGESCADAAGRWFDCGAAAAEALARLVNGRSVVCLVAGRDRFGRGLGLCSAGGAELNAGLVSAGWALAGADDTDLLAREAEARLAARGLWAGGLSRPEDWRARN